MVAISPGLLTGLSINCQKVTKKAHYNFPLPKIMYLDGLFYSIYSPELKDIPFTLIYDKEKAANLHFEVS